MTNDTEHGNRFKNKLTPDQVQDAVARVAAGETREAVAVSLGVSRMTLYRYLKALQRAEEQAAEGQKRVKREVRNARRRGDVQVQPRRKPELRGSEDEKEAMRNEIRTLRREIRDRDDAAEEQAKRERSPGWNPGRVSYGGGGPDRGRVGRKGSAKARVIQL